MLDFSNFQISLALKLTLRSFDLSNLSLFPDDDVLPKSNFLQQSLNRIRLFMDLSGFDIRMLQGWIFEPN